MMMNASIKSYAAHNVLKEDVAVVGVIYWLA